MQEAMHLYLPCGINIEVYLQLNLNKTKKELMGKCIYLKYEMFLMFVDFYFALKNINCILAYSSSG